jgi:head-tail adaptor
MIVVRPGELEHFVRLERRIESADFGSAGTEEWELVDEIWIGIRDSLPSRGERTDGGFTTSTRPARVRMYWRTARRDARRRGAVRNGPPPGATCRPR